VSPVSTSGDVLTLIKFAFAGTLSYSVTYWDYLGWKDIFGSAAFTARQVAYEPKLGQSSPFTPLMVINGKANTVGYDLPKSLNSSRSRKRSALRRSLWTKQGRR
jgi:hypothetical protein